MENNYIDLVELEFQISLLDQWLKDKFSEKKMLKVYADKCGLSPATASQFKNGLCQIRVEKMIEIYKVLRDIT